MGQLRTNSFSLEGSTANFYVEDDDEEEDDEEYINDNDG